MNGVQQKIQIKSRCVPNPQKLLLRVGRIDAGGEWDSVVLVLMDLDFQLHYIYEAFREKIIHELKKPGSKARNERGALSVSQFIKIAEQRYSK